MSTDLSKLNAKHEHEWLRIGSPEEQELSNVIRINPNDGTWIVNLPFTLRCRHCGLRGAVVEEHRYGPRTNSLTIDDIRAERLLFPSHGGVSDNPNPSDLASSAALGLTREELQTISDEFFDANERRSTEHSDGYLLRWAERHGRDLLIVLFRAMRTQERISS